MALTPKLPPGRSNRKALAYTTEIQRLRAWGYSFEAIRLTLLGAGLSVSRTTLKREAAKRPAHATSPPQHPDPQQQTTASTPLPVRLEPATAPPTPGSFAGDARSGQEIVDAFMQGRISNPLLQARTRHETRRD